MASVTALQLVAFSITPAMAAPAVNNDPNNSCARLDDQFRAVDAPTGTNFTPPASLTSNFPRYCTVSVAIRAVLNILFGLVGAGAVLFIVLGGFQFLTSAGNPKMAEKGKKTLLYAVIGLVVVVLATTIVNVVVKLITTG